MPRKINNKEINDMRRIVEIMLQHPKIVHKRMFDFIIESVAYHSKEVKQ